MAEHVPLKVTHRSKSLATLTAENRMPFMECHFMMFEILGDEESFITLIAHKVPFPFMKLHVQIKIRWILERLIT